MKPLFVRNGFMNLQKLLFVVKPFYRDFFKVVFHTFASQRYTKFPCFLYSVLFSFEGFLCIYFSTWFGYK